MKPTELIVDTGHVSFLRLLLLSSIVCGGRAETCRVSTTQSSVCSTTCFKYFIKTPVFMKNIIISKIDSKYIDMLGHPYNVLWCSS